MTTLPNAAKINHKKRMVLLMRREELLNEPFGTEERSMEDDFKELARTLRDLRKEVDAINSRLDIGVHSLRESLNSGSRAFENDLKLASRVKALENWAILVEERLGKLVK